MKIVFIAIIFLSLFSVALPSFAASNDVEKINSFKKFKNIVRDKFIKTPTGKIKKLAEDDKGVFTVVFENDVFVGKDSGYTNGFMISYVSPEEKMPDFMRHSFSYLPFLSPDGKKRVSLALGQNIYTPHDITKTEFVKNDYLYAGWLYSSLGIISDNGTTFDNAVLTLGMIGPSALAEQTQKFVHRVTDNTNPRGWNNQLKDELGINFAYERKWREILQARHKGIEVEAIPHLGANIGNVSTNASVGVTVRLGNNLPYDYGAPRIRPSLPGSDFFIPTKKPSGYLFSTIEARAVARDIFLDGNTFKDSPNVAKKIMLVSLQIGAVVTYKEMRISYSHVFITDQFKGQRDNGHQFGGLAFSYRF